MLGRIGGKPAFSFYDIVSRETNLNKIVSLNNARHYYFFSARYALAAGIHLLGIGSDNTVLLPSYNCGVEIDPFHYYEVKTEFYRIDRNLLVDLEDVKKKITHKVKAVLVTHFLGFPQPIDEIKKICVERNLFLIEDCAHAFLSSNNKKALGSCGDISIFSLLKTLPVPNGGILLINNKDIKYQHNSSNPSLFSTYYYASELLKHRTIRNNNSYKESASRIIYGGIYSSLSYLKLLLAGFRKVFHQKGLYLVRPDSYIFLADICSWGISGLSRKIIAASDFEKIKAIRRRNFEYLLNYFLENERGILPFRELPPGVCPLFFPIIVENSDKREKLYKMLRSRGVVTHPWWDRFHHAVPWEEFPDAVYLKQRLFGLPIHQDLTIEHIDRLIEEFETAYKHV